MTSKIVFEITGLWFHFATYSRKDKYQGGYTIKEGLSQYQGRQQRCSDTKKRTMNEKDDSRSNHTKENNKDGRLKHIKRN